MNVDKNGWNGQSDNTRDEDEEDDDIFKQAIFVSALVGEYAVNHLCKEPCRISELTSHSLVQEILQGNATHCYAMFRMEKHVFNLLCSELVELGLKSCNRMTVEEMVAMFLVVVGHGVGNRMIQEMFQHSDETVSRYFH
jgi:hypothetical protein